MSKAKERPTLERLAETRQALATVVAEAQRIAALPPTVQEVDERVDAYFAALAGTFNPTHRFVSFLGLETPGVGTVSLMPIGRFETEAAIACLLGEPLKELAKSRLAAMLSGQETIGAAERTERLASLVEMRRDLERREELIIREAEAAAVDVDRRRDADPAVIFAVADQIASMDSGGIP